MSPPPLRPLPDRVVFVAFPQAAVPLIVSADPHHIELPSPTPVWLTLARPLSLAPGLSRIDCTATVNPREARGAELHVAVRRKAWPVRFQQQPGLLVQTQQLRVLNTPLTVDMTVLVTFAAEQISKIPVPPIKLVVTVLAVLVLIALGLIAALLRHAFANVPEPRPLSTDTLGQPVTVVPGVSVEGVLPLPFLAVEDQTIALQTIQSIYWLLTQIK